MAPSPEAEPRLEPGLSESEGSGPPAASGNVTEIAWFHVLCALVGLALAGYSWHLHNLVVAGADTGCGISESISCDKVIGSKPWGAPFGVPLGVFGLVYFAIVLLTSFAKVVDRPTAVTQRLLVACVGILFSLGLEFVMWVILRHGCPVCIITHLVTVVNLGFALVAWRRERPPLPLFLRGNREAGSPHKTGTAGD